MEKINFSKNYGTTEKCPRCQAENFGGVVSSENKVCANCFYEDKIGG